MQWKKLVKMVLLLLKKANHAETVLDVVEGMQFDRGYISPYFVTDTETMEAVLEDPFILIHDKKISAMKDLLPVLKKLHNKVKQW